MLAMSASWTYGLISQSVRASERNSLVLGLNSTQANFQEHLQRTFSGEYHMYQLIPLRACD